jgi:LasA protease
MPRRKLPVPHPATSFDLQPAPRTLRLRAGLSLGRRGVARFLTLLAALALSLSACLPAPAPSSLTSASTVTAAAPAAAATGLPPVTPEATRPAYSPGQLVDYTAQTGDTLPALAARFNTSVDEIRQANPIIPKGATTMPPGMPMQIPIYYRAFWGSPYQIVPDGQFVYGPDLIGFDTSAFVAQHPGWLNGYVEYAADATRTGAEIVDYVAERFSVSSRLLLALLEYQSGALTNPQKPDTPYVLGYHDYTHAGLYLQLVWAANLLNNGYYGWRRGTLLEFDLPDGRIERPDPWQNAATVSLHNFFSTLLPIDAYTVATERPGFARTWKQLFGDPWKEDQPPIPVSLQQPLFYFPFSVGESWNLTGGPHTAWGSGEPYAALDFAPTGVSGCSDTDRWATAVADGVIVKSDHNMVMLDLDGDGDERTGWVIFYLHLSDNGMVPLGTHVHAGDPIGHPSCQGGEATGTHVHIARKYDGEWMLADSPVPFEMEGWIAQDGPRPYLGGLVRQGQSVTASDKAENFSQVTAGQ